jgi:exonuclease SbcC
MSNFKGGSEQYHLAGIDVFTGPNGTGKTRVLQSLQLALSGSVSHPIEDRNIDLIELFTKRADVATMTVAVETDNEDLREIEREFSLNRKNGKDSVTQSIGLVPMTVKGVTESERKIKELVGDFPYMLDVHKFIRLSDDKRAELVFRFSPIDESKWTPDSIRNRLIDESAIDILDSDDHAGVAVSILESALQNLGGKVTSASIAAVLAWLKSKESEIRKEVRGNQSASITSIQMSDVDGKKSFRHVEDIKLDRSNAIAQRDELVGKIMESRTTLNAIRRLEQERDSLREQVANARKDTETGSLDKARAELEALRAGLPDLGPLSAEVERFRDLANRAAHETDVCRFRRDDQDKVTAELEQKIASLSQGKCPTCGSDSGALVESLGAEYRSAVDVLNSLNQEYNKAVISLRDLQQQLSAKIADHQALQAEVMVKQRAISSAERDIANLEGRAQNISVLERRLRELEHTNVEGDAIDIDEAELQLEGIKSRIAALEVELNEKQRYDIQVETAKTAALHAKRAEESLSVVQALIGATNSIRWEIVKDALEPIRSEATEIFSTMGYGDSRFDFQFTDSRGNEVFQFGWRIATPYGEMFVDFDSLSTAQQIFTLISLLAPLIHRGSPKLRVLLMDNIEVVHEDFRPGLMKLLTKVHGRFLDNVLMASSAEYPLHDGVAINELTGGIEHAA